MITLTFFILLHYYNFLRMKKVSLINLMCLVALSVLLASCKDDDAPYFERSGYLLDCFLDADEEYSLEDAVGRTLDASCSISNENEGVAELQVDQETGKHIIIAKKIGRTRINLVRGEEHVSVCLQLQSAEFSSSEKTHAGTKILFGHLSYPLYLLYQY